MTRVVGKPLPKVDAHAKVTGQTLFADDLFLPRMLHCKILRSSHPHARIVSIDASRALALPGVKAVITGRDLPIKFGILPVSQDEESLCLEKVRFVGDPVAAVAAVEEEIAEAALELIDVVYEPLRPVGSIEAALAAGGDGREGHALDAESPREAIHDYGDGTHVTGWGAWRDGTAAAPRSPGDESLKPAAGHGSPEPAAGNGSPPPAAGQASSKPAAGNGSPRPAAGHPDIHKLVALEFGDVDEALAGSGGVREDVFFYQGNTHLPMEQHAALAQATPDGKLTLWTSSQTPHYVHRALAKVLEMPPARIRVIATPNGGGFGGKSDPFAHEMVVAKLALLTGRPVKICLTREEVFYCHRGRHPVLMWVKTGYKKDGAITGMHFRSWLDGGAYGSYGVASTYYTGALQTVTYHVPRYKFEGLRVFTNKPPCGPKRGHGTPQPRFALEVQLDKIAEELAIDPAEIRLRHLTPPHSITANWLRIGSKGLEACIRKVVAASGWKDKFRKLPYGRGIGLACSSYITGAGLPIYWNAMPHSGVIVKLDRGGGVAVLCGSIDIGQGSDSVLAYIVAEVLGIDPGDIRVHTGDTDLTPIDLGSYSSRVTLMTGNAAIQAAERAREIVAAGAAKKLEVPVERVVFAGGRVFDAEDPSRGLGFDEAVRLAEAENGTIACPGSYTPPRSPGRYRGAGVGPSPAYSYTAAVTEVEVDPETGVVTVPRAWIAHDVGRAINPLLAIGQVEGSVYMGLGEALMEEMDYRENRNVVHRHPSMLEYKSPTTHEMCEIETFLIEDPDPNGPFGAKECGQGPLLPIPPAVANAVYDAVGVRVDEVPLSPPRVLKAIRSGEKRYGPTRLPDAPWPEPIRVPPPWEGGNGEALPEGVGWDGRTAATGRVEAGR
jgi:4-hydroxybenzoyl-CoA reductase alpha subunit